MNDDDIELFIEYLCTGLVELPPIAFVAVVPTSGVPRQRAPQVPVHLHVLSSDAHLLPVDVYAKIRQQRHGAMQQSADGATRSGRRQAEDAHALERRCGRPKRFDGLLTNDGRVLFDGVGTGCDAAEHSVTSGRSVAGILEETIICTYAGLVNLFDQP